MTLNTSTNGAITTTIVVNRQRIKLMSVYFPTRSMRTTTSRKCTKRSRSTLQIAKDTHSLLEEISIQNWDLVTEQNAQVLAGTQSTRETNVNTTPQMTRFRDEQVCNNLATDEIDDHRIQSDYKSISGLQNPEGKNLVFGIASTW